MLKRDPLYTSSQTDRQRDSQSVCQSDSLSVRQSVSQTVRQSESFRKSNVSSSVFSCTFLRLGTTKKGIGPTYASKVLYSYIVSNLFREMFSCPFFAYLLTLTLLFNICIDFRNPGQLLSRVQRKLILKLAPRASCSLQVILTSPIPQLA